MNGINKHSKNTVGLVRLLKAKEVAEILNIGRSHAYHLMQSGEIPTVRLGKSCRVRPRDMADYIEKNIRRR